MSMFEKMHAGRAPEATQRVGNSSHVLQPPEAIPSHKVGQGLSWLKRNFLGSPEIPQSDLTDTDEHIQNPGVTSLVLH